MSADPDTPEGQLVRAARKRKRLNLRDGAAAAGMSPETLGYIERGRNNRGGAYVTSDADLARIAAEFGIPAEELERIGRDQAAALLRAFPAPVTDPGILALLDELFYALAAGRPDRDVLLFLWRALDGDGNLKPLAERVRSVADWADADGRARRAERPSETG